MRRLFIGLVVAATTALLPALALAGNQEAAESIAKGLRESGQLHDYKIGVKFQDGTAWLKGQVCSESQAQLATKLVSGMDGVQKVRNDLTVIAPGVPVVVAQKAVVEVPTMPAAPRPAERVATSFAPKPVQQVTATEETAQPEAVEPQPMQSVPRARFASAQAQPMPAAAVRAPQGPLPAYTVAMHGGHGAARYDQPNLPNYAWPSYAAHPNCAAVTYPRQYSPQAWPYIGPFYPYPQVPLGWRKVTLEWDSGWWMLDFHDHH